MNKLLIDHLNNVLNDNNKEKLLLLSSNHNIISGFL